MFLHQFLSKIEGIKVNKCFFRGVDFRADYDDASGDVCHFDVRGEVAAQKRRAEWGTYFSTII